LLLISTPVAGNVILGNYVAGANNGDTESAVGVVGGFNINQANSSFSGVFDANGNASAPHTFVIQSTFQPGVPFSLNVSAFANASTIALGESEKTNTTLNFLGFKDAAGVPVPFAITTPEPDTLGIDILDATRWQEVQRLRGDLRALWQFSPGSHVCGPIQRLEQRLERRTPQRSHAVRAGFPQLNVERSYSRRSFSM
jgi:hypothetical protein